MSMCTPTPHAHGCGGVNRRQATIPTEVEEATGVPEQSSSCHVTLLFVLPLVGSVLRWSRVSYSVRGIVLPEDTDEIQVKQPDKGKLEGRRKIFRDEEANLIDLLHFSYLK